MAPVWCSVRCAPQVRELFNPDYGMFVYDEKARLHWFRPSHLDMDTEFELVGILVGAFWGAGGGAPEGEGGRACSGDVLLMEVW